MDQESISQAVVVGHDFGAVLASRMCCFQPDRISGLITLGTAYVPPSPFPLDFEALKAMQEKHQGYCSSWCFQLFTSDHGASTLDAHIENMFTALHGGGTRMKDVLCVENGLENWLTDENNKNAEVLPYATEDFRKARVTRLANDGFSGPLSWYKAMLGNLDLEAQKAVPSKGQHILKIPYLFIATLQDPLFPPAVIHSLIALGMLPDVTIKEIDTGHWGMLEMPDEFGEVATGWLDERFGSG